MIYKYFCYKLSQYRLCIKSFYKVTNINWDHATHIMFFGDPPQFINLLFLKNILLWPIRDYIVLIPILTGTVFYTGDPGFETIGDLVFTTFYFGLTIKVFLIIFFEITFLEGFCTLNLFSTLFLSLMNDTFIFGFLVIWL